MRRVVQTFGVTREYWYVSYFDGREWIDATGPWEGILNVQPFYSDVDAAMMVAKQLNTVSGNLTRVEKEDKDV